ncbi:hypothetical protein ABZU75_17075, partial [Streptosporangium sp. NPDC005286]|uniref:hypothetical protein n=1 Tax=Streptosporangium sp. NPDC005286 TaxID=3154463 RepID=UPI00339FE620
MTTGLKARVDAKRARTADLAVREVTAAIAQVATGDVRETAPDMVSAERGARAVLPALVTVATGRPTTVTTVVPAVLLSTETTGRAVGRGLRGRVVTTSAPMVIATSPEAVPTEPVTAGTGRPSTVTIVVSVGRSTVMTVRVGSVRRSTVTIVVSVGRSTVMTVRVGSVVRTVTAISRVVSMVRVPIVVSAGRST